MTIRYGANGMPMKPKEDEMLSEILEVNPNKKKKKETVVEDTPDLSSDWEVEEEETDEEL
jgi:hypothetical protein